MSSIDCPSFVTLTSSPAGGTCCYLVVTIGESTLAEAVKSPLDATPNCKDDAPKLGRRPECIVLNTKELVMKADTLSRITLFS